MAQLGTHAGYLEPQFEKPKVNFHRGRVNHQAE
jgi:hypothetical protein